MSEIIERRQTETANGATNVITYMTDPREADRLCWVEPTTGEFVTECPYCGAKASHHYEQPLHDFRFPHKRWCMVGLGTTPGEV